MTLAELSLIGDRAGAGCVPCHAALCLAQHDVLDRIALGIILLDRLGQVIHVNRAASRLAAEGRPVRIARRNLVAATQRNDKRLEALIRSALRGMPPAAIGIPSPEDGKLVTVLAMPLRERDRERLNGLDVRDAAAIVFLSDPTFIPEIPVKWVMDAFGLTRAEARVAMSTAAGASVPETAAQLGSSPNTVKTHLRRAFEKTGVGRRSELANLLAGFRLLAHEPDEGNRLRARPSSLPVLQAQLRYAGKLADIVRDEDHVARHRLAGDQHVIGADRRPPGHQK